jgi:carboxylate-amine ligase
MTASDTERLRAAFEGESPLTVGLEEELMVLDPVTLDLAPRAHHLLAALDRDARFKGELPAAQIELITDPAPTVDEAARQVAAARATLAAAAAGTARLAGAGAHPFAAAEGELSTDDAYLPSRADSSCSASTSTYA